MIVIFISISVLSFSCKEDWLDTDAESFYEPSVTLTTESGMESILAACNRHYLHYYGTYSGACYTDMLFSDMAVNGTTDKSGPAQDLNTQITPSSTNNDANTNRINLFWTNGYEQVKYANSIIDNIDNVEDADEDTKKEILGRAYFHRAMAYYSLIFSFGDVPLITKYLTTPKLDYYSTEMGVIIEKMISDLEYAVQNVPDFIAFGASSKGACRMLLAKYYLANSEFDKAKAQTDTVIDYSGYTLMTDNFGTFENPSPDVHNITENVIWDLHRPTNKSISENKEVIYSLVNKYSDSESRLRLRTMRNATPCWSFSSGTNGPLTPNTKITAMVCTTSDSIDLRTTYGRGIGRSRATWYATNSIWDDDNDLRHSRSTGNWMTMYDMVYNNPDMIGTDDEAYFGKNVQLYDDNDNLLVKDSIRCWGAWPHYKLWVEDEANADNVNYNGGPEELYIFRLAEAYLLRAEANVWLGNNSEAADDINIVRKRAECTNLYSTADIGTIMDERARELSFEEFRHMEMVRTSYIFAKEGASDEFGNSYSFTDVASISQNSYWKERIDHYNNFYNSGIRTTYGVEYTISNFHVLWPIPQDEIDANLYGVINQNYGYDGYSNNVEPFNNLEDALAAEED